MNLPIPLAAFTSHGEVCHARARARAEDLERSFIVNDITAAEWQVAVAGLIKPSFNPRKRSQGTRVCLARFYLPIPKSNLNVQIIIEGEANTVVDGKHLCAFVCFGNGSRFLQVQDVSGTVMAHPCSVDGTGEERHATTKEQAQLEQRRFVLYATRDT